VAVLLEQLSLFNLVVEMIPVLQRAVGYGYMGNLQFGEPAQETIFISKKLPLRMTTTCVSALEEKISRRGTLLACC